VGKLDIDVAEVRRLIELAEKHNLDELRVGEGDLSITIVGRARREAVQAVATGPSAHLEEHPDTPEDSVVVEVEETVEHAGNLVDIVAPLVGVFYRAPSPDAPMFVEVGDSIEVGSEVGLIEAMKVFSPIPSEVSGVVVEIPVENGKLVQQGQVLVRVRVSEE